MPQLCVLTYIYPHSGGVPTLHIDGIEFPELVNVTLENRYQERNFVEYSYARATMTFECNTVESHPNEDREECLINGKSVAGVLSHLEITDKGKRAVILQQMGPFALNRFPQGILTVAWQPVRQGTPYEVKGIGVTSLDALRRTNF